MDSNYGFNLPWWDRVFGVYRAQPRQGHVQMLIGLNEFRDNKSVNVLWLPAKPFLQPDKDLNKQESSNEC